MNSMAFNSSNGMGSGMGNGQHMRGGGGAGFQEMMGLSPSIAPSFHQGGGTGVPGEPGAAMLGILPQVQLAAEEHLQLLRLKQLQGQIESMQAQADALNAQSMQAQAHELNAQSIEGMGLSGLLGKMASVGVPPHMQSSHQLEMQLPHINITVPQGECDFGSWGGTPIADW